MPRSPSATAETASDFSSPDCPGALSRLVTTLQVKLARAKARRSYREMLTLEDEALSNLGITRDDVRLALLACGGSFSDGLRVPPRHGPQAAPAGPIAAPRNRRR
jgi:uncharacterized protein YjiS (DUF1127 family)